MKNTKHHKFLLSGFVLFLAIFLNIHHCQKSNTSTALNLNGLLTISTCQIEGKDVKGAGDPILYSPSTPDEDLTEEEYLELLRRQRS